MMLRSVAVFPAPLRPSSTTTAARGAAEPGARIEAGGRLHADAYILEHRHLAEYLGHLEGAEDAERGAA